MHLRGQAVGADAHRAHRRSEHQPLAIAAAAAASATAAAAAATAAATAAAAAAPSADGRRALRAAQAVARHVGDRAEGRGRQRGVAEARVEPAQPREAPPG